MANYIVQILLYNIFSRLNQLYYAVEKLAAPLNTPAHNPSFTLRHDESIAFSL